MTPDSLYAALDCENADIDLILGQIADWYEERGDCWRAECLQWCRAEGKRPANDATGSLGWLGMDGPNQGRHYLPFNRTPEYWECLCRDTKFPDYLHTSVSYKRAADAWHALRERGEVPVAGMDSERLVGT